MKMNKYGFITFVFISFFILLIYSSIVNAEIVLKKDSVTLNEVLNAIAKDKQLKLVNNINEKKNKAQINQMIEGESVDILYTLSDVYDFEWYIYGGVITVESERNFINYTFRPKNIKINELILELKDVFITSKTIKIKTVERGNTILFSGPRTFINDVLAYSTMVDNNEFLQNGNELEIARLEFKYLSVVDRQVDTFDGTVTFPGAGALISAALSNMGQFENIADGKILEQTYKVKLGDGSKQKLEEAEKTSKVQVLPGTNALLVRGTPEEIELAKRIANIIDVKGKQLMFSLKVYDVSVERREILGRDPSLLNGTVDLYSVLSSPFSLTTDFIKSFQAMYSNGMARSIYSTNLLVLENYQGHFGKKDTITLNLVSNREIKSLKIEADNSIYLTGRILPNDEVQAKIKYIEEHFDDSSNNDIKNSPPKISSQELTSEAYIKKDQTVVLGGFENVETQSLESGVPILSSIPWIGNIFKNSDVTKHRFKRYIAISYQVIE